MLEFFLYTKFITQRSESTKIMNELLLPENYFWMAIIRKQNPFCQDTIFWTIPFFLHDT